MLKKILKKVKKIDISANNKINSLFAGNYRSVFLGRGIEFADLRPYEWGDDIRDIDWKTTSKQGEVFIKKYHESRDNTLFFIFDTSLPMFFTSEEKENKIENLLETFAILAFAADKNGDRVGAILPNGKELKIFPPKKGKRNILKILSEAVKVYSKKNAKAGNGEDINNIFKITSKILKQSSVVFWLTGKIHKIHKNLKLEKSIKAIGRKNDFIPIIFSDKEERELKTRGEYTFQDASTGRVKEIIITDDVANKYKSIYKNKRKNFSQFFRKYRMESIFIDENKKIYKNLLSFFKKRQMHKI